MKKDRSGVRSQRAGYFRDGDRRNGVGESRSLTVTTWHRDESRPQPTGSGGRTRKASGGGRKDGTATREGDMTRDAFPKARNEPAP